METSPARIKSFTRYSDPSFAVFEIFSYISQKKVNFKTKSSLVLWNCFCIGTSVTLLKYIIAGTFLLSFKCRHRLLLSNCSLVKWIIKAVALSRWLSTLLQFFVLEAFNELTYVHGLWVCILNVRNAGIVLAVESRTFWNCLMKFQ